MHTLSPKEISTLLAHINESQPDPELPAAVLAEARKVLRFALAPTHERVGGTHYLTMPGTNLILRSHPVDDGWHWSGMTTDGRIYQNDLANLVNIFLSEDGREAAFLINKIRVEDAVIWVEGEYDFVLTREAK